MSNVRDLSGNQSANGPWLANRQTFGYPRKTAMKGFADRKQNLFCVPELILWTGTPIDLVGFALLNGNVICGHIGETDEKFLIWEIWRKTQNSVSYSMTGGVGILQKLKLNRPESWQIIRCDLPSGRLSLSPSCNQPPSACSRLVEAVADYFAGRRFSFSDIPLALGNCSEFTRTVLEGCRTIPYGQTVTYRQLAANIGRPKAIRAVAQALARNPIPILIPCHRVIGSDGSLRGFSAGGGINTKRKLLLMEHDFLHHRSSTAGLNCQQTAHSQEID